ncbi:MAG: patatin-like phospholipase family protein [Pseudomonadota bacterium]
MAFRNAIFAGGGSRCVWQLGFWEGANRAGLGLDKTVDYAASTSAGCAMATAAMLDRGPEAMAMFLELVARNPANVHWHNLLPGRNGRLLPHIDMYRECLERLLSDDDLAPLQQRRVEFLIARPPRWLNGGLGAMTAFSVYGLEKALTGALHPRWTRRLGFEPVVGGSQDAANIGEFIDTILASSCVPPVLPGGRFRGERMLDGGMIDNVPAFLADGREGATLVLLSKRYRNALPAHRSRVYVQPSEPITIDKFDYANAKGIQWTYDLGIRNGTAFANSERVLALQEAAAACG